MPFFLLWKTRYVFKNVSVETTFDVSDFHFMEKRIQFHILFDLPRWLQVTKPLNFHNFFADIDFLLQMNSIKLYYTLPTLHLPTLSVCEFDYFIMCNEIALTYPSLPKWICSLESLLFFFYYLVILCNVFPPMCLLCWIASSGSNDQNCSVQTSA